MSVCSGEDSFLTIAFFSLKLLPNPTDTQTPRDYYRKCWSVHEYKKHEIQADVKYLK